jgi:hypothetical protein
MRPETLNDPALPMQLAGGLPLRWNRAGRLLRGFRRFLPPLSPALFHHL